MHLPRPKRGRPKGSGIDDRSKLRDIAALLSSQPHIKPTTAIKLLGETDPSVIRRLRDKFYSMQTELMSELRQGPRPTVATPGFAQPAPAMAAATTASQHCANPNHALDRRVGEVTAARPAAEAAAPSSEGSEIATADRLTELAAYNVMLGFAIQATVSAIRQQVQICEQTMKLPPIIAMLRQQIEIGEMIMSVAWPRIESPRQHA